MQRTDEELMAGLLGGQIEALSGLYDRYASLVFSVSSASCTTGNSRKT